MTDQVRVELVEPVAARRPSPAQRFEALVLVIALVGLALTGLPQKFADQGWARTAIDLLGGIESARIIHRAMALLLLAEAVYHVLALIYHRVVLGMKQARLPGLRDVRLAVQRLLANFGLARPADVSEKQLAVRVEYLVLAVSVLILAVTGLMLWNPLFVARVLPGEAIPTAQSIHSDHALLLVVFLVIWRLAMALLWRGPRTSPAEGSPTLASAPVAARRGPFLIVAGVVLIVAAVALVWFLTAERTAINTVPQRVAAIYMPQVHPDEGDPQVGAALWATLRCAFCHGQDAQGGTDGQPALRNSSRLTFASFYQRVRVGSETMPRFSPEELPDGYLIHLWAWLTTSG